MTDSTFPEFEHQVELAEFPSGVTVTQLPEQGGMLLRVLSGDGGMELLLTDEACQMYGRGPALNLALSRLKQAVEQGLPPVQASGSYERVVFLGD